ncbi:MAG: hypothetical protein K2L13_00380, partial [Opitutales bacterium]|nr:hypothetical protein [Opitutales bacterium]
NGCRYAVRASGTEPKLKFYMFCESIVQGNLDSTREKTDRQLDNMKNFLEADAEVRSRFQA